MGGKRKSKKKVVSKVKLIVPKVFKCPYCANDGSVEAKLDRQAETGSVTCRVCGESFQARITTLDDPVDVYTAWIDALEASKGAVGGAAGGREGAGAGAGTGSRGGAAERPDADDSE
jgi:transcription elongation factor Elf1